MLNILTCIILISFTFSSANACKCVGPYKDIEDMYRQADIVFYGRQVLSELDNKIDTFEIIRLIKSKIPLGTNKLITHKSAAWNAMCGGRYENLHDYIVFININPLDKSLSTMDECYSDVVSSDGRKYHFRNQDFAEFSFFKVNPLSAGNGVIPLYADTLNEIQVREFALRKAREWRKKNVPAVTTDKTSEVTSISSKQDAYGQTYWAVRIERTRKDRAKGDFEIVDIYNTFQDGVIIYPGR